MNKIKLGLVDDHQIFLKSLSMLLNSLPSFEVLIEAYNGKDLQIQLSNASSIPDIILTDYTMPIMDGIETTKWLVQNYPSLKIIALSVNNNDSAIIEMIKAGCCAYLLKDIHPNELEKAIIEVDEKGFYNGDAFNINHRRLLLNQQQLNKVNITDKEKEFLQYASTDLTYKQIADKMGITPRTVDNYREVLFQKFNVQSRVGLVLETIRKGYINL